MRHSCRPRRLLALTRRPSSRVQAQRARERSFTRCRFLELPGLRAWSGSLVSLSVGRKRCAAASLLCTLEHDVAPEHGHVHLCGMDREQRGLEQVAVEHDQIGKLARSEYASLGLIVQEKGPGGGVGSNRLGERDAFVWNERGTAASRARGRTSEAQTRFPTDP